MECNFCKNILSSKSSLNYHIKNNKKCLQIQNKSIGNINSALIICKYCDKNFSISNINTHITNCKFRKKNEDEKLKNENEKFKNENEKLIIDYENKIQELKSEYENKIKELNDIIIELKTENSIYKKDHETIVVLRSSQKLQII